ncbi:anti-sigma factor family protein [Planctomycetota bacterium]
MIEKGNIDEMLNGYIDGELSTRQMTEIKRLIRNDQQIAEKLKELQKCKVLLQSLPKEQAPAGMMDDIKAAMERKTLLSSETLSFDQQQGSKHLILRKIASVAAMVVLMAVLGAVVYMVVAPQGRSVEPTVSEPIALAPTEPAAVVTTAEPAKEAVATVEARPFYARLELKTSQLESIDAVIKKSIAEAGLTNKLSGASEQSKGLYVISCSSQNLSLLLAQMQRNWNKFKAPTLVVNSDSSDKQIKVKDVTTNQIAEIVGSDTLEGSLETAREFALLNKSGIGGLLGNQEMIVDDSTGNDLTAIPKRIPKPKLTWDEAAKTADKDSESGLRVYLTIVVEEIQNDNE